MGLQSKMVIILTTNWAVVGRPIYERKRKGELNVCE